MSLTKRQKRALIVHGYARRTSSEFDVLLPVAVIRLVEGFYPGVFDIYGVGRNNYGSLGLNHCKSIYKFQRLHAFSELIDDVNAIHVNNQNFMVRTTQNQIYCIGRSFTGMRVRYYTETKANNISISISFQNFVQNPDLSWILYLHQLKKI